MTGEEDKKTDYEGGATSQSESGGLNVGAKLSLIIVFASGIVLLIAWTLFAIVQHYALGQHAAVVIVFPLSLLLAWAFSLWAKRLISDPVTDLLATTRKVLQDRDFSGRAVRKTDDEVGYLADAFNEMLDHVQKRDDQLRRYSEGMEKDVAERTAKLVAEKEKAEENSRLKDKFVSLVSHDLRSPIASSIVYLGRIRADESGGDGDLQKDLLSRCAAGMNRMLEMIDSLLDINRLQGGDVRLVKSFENGQSVCSMVVDMLQPLAEEKGVIIENQIMEGTRIYAASDLFEELLRNLVTNAIKFCSKGDKITIYSPEGRPATIAVADTGTGINEDFLESLFKKEVKTTQPGTKGEPGSGLGLPFCNDIMAAHGGSIKVESEEGRGSTFFMEFPDIKPVVLVVDDHEGVRQTFIELLHFLDVEIAEAADGVEALAQIEKQRPHLIIADIYMPRMDGFELLEKVKGDETTRDIPTIIATSQAGVEVRDKVFKLGADDYVSKPVMEEDFIPRVRRFIG